MCTYCGTDNYRKIYENHTGTIPTESNGRSYQIHHIDGDHNNNDPANLTAVTLQEHYDIHYQQGDYSACVLLGHVLSIDPVTLSEIAKKANSTRIANGTHHLMKKADGSSHATKRAKQGLLPTQQASKNGTHHWIEAYKNGTHPNQIAAKNGTHPFQTGIHASKIKVTCLCCKQPVSVSAFARNHIKKSCK